MNIKDYRASVPAATNRILDLLISGDQGRKKLSFPLNFVVKVNPIHLRFKPNQIQAPTYWIDLWLFTNCKKGCGPLITYQNVGFEDEEEAMLFKLTWG